MTEAWTDERKALTLKMRKKMAYMKSVVDIAAIEESQSDDRAARDAQPPIAICRS